MVIAMMFAYLDPGSGSALLGTVFAVFGAALFSLRGLFYRLLGKDTSQGAENPKTIAIFSEGKNYWGTFKGIVEELIRREVPFAYYTYDLNDPALKILSPYMYARLYNKEIVSSFVKLSNIEAEVCLATTPNISTPGYPLKKSKKIRKLVHVFHSADNVDTYAKGSLDHYDSVLMAGSYQAPFIRELEAKRNLQAKELVPMGLPYLDDLVETLKKLPPMEKRETLTILVAPSWGDKGCLKVYGIGFVVELAKRGYHVILRPHPQSYQAEAELVAEWRRATESYPNVEWDARVRPIESLRIADVLISDVSAVRFDYVYIFSRPVITLSVPLAKDDQYEAADLSSVWVDEVAPRIGRVLTKDEIGTLLDVVREMLANPAGLDLKAFRDEMVANYGRSVSAVVDYLVAQVKKGGK